MSDFLLEAKPFLEALAERLETEVKGREGQIATLQTAKDTLRKVVPRLTAAEAVCKAAKYYRLAMLSGKTSDLSRIAKALDDGLLVWQKEAE